MLKSTKQRVLTNLNDINAVIKMETPDTAYFGHNGMFTLQEAFLSYKDDAGEPIFSAFEATQTSGTYRLLFNDNNHEAVDNILIDVNEKFDAIGNWNDASVHYRYITMNDVEVSGQNAQAQGKSFWQEHYKLMSGTIPEVVDTNKFDRPHQRRPQRFHMSYSDIARSSGSPLTTQSQNNSQYGASVNTTVASNVSRQETNDSGMNMIMGLSLMKKRMEEKDNQREAFTTKQQIMYEIVSKVISSVSKLSADILAVGIDMNIMSDKLKKKFNEIIALLATTQTPVMPSSPMRKVARGTNTSPVKHAESNKGPVKACGGRVTQSKTQSPPASPLRKANAEIWANMCDEEAQEENMHSSVNILMEVDSADQRQSMRLPSSMGGESAALTHPPVTQDSVGIVHDSRRRNQQFGKEGNPGQVQTYKVPPEALAIFVGKPLAMWNHQKKYPVKEQTNKVRRRPSQNLRLGR
jgi:hypothetical protein